MNDAELLPDVLSIWQVPPLSPPGEDASGAGAMGSEAPLWRLDLSADPVQASCQLDRAEAQLAAYQAALAGVLERVEALGLRRRGEARGETALEAAALPAPEAAASSLLDGIERMRLAPAGFEAGAIPDAGRDRASAQLESSLHRLRQTMARLVWVETLVQGRPLGRTAVSWTGDLSTCWAAGTGPDQIDLHLRSLALALASRRTLLRMFLVASQSAAQLSILQAAPGGALLALPAAWKFVNQILAGVER